MVLMVMVGQGEQLDTGLGGECYDVGGGEDAVGVCGVGLQVEAGRHGRKGM